MMKAQFQAEYGMLSGESVETMNTGLGIPGSTGPARFPDSSSHPFCVFGEFLFDRTRGLLFHLDEINGLVPLPRKAYQVLAVLVARPGEVVEKAELFAAVWPDTVVEDNTLARHVATLRKALHERPDEHTYVSTIPGHGYQFVAPVRFLTADPRGNVALLPETANAAASTTSNGVDASNHPIVQLPSRLPMMAWGAGVVLTVALIAAVLWPRRSPVTPPPNVHESGHEEMVVNRSLRQVTFGYQGSGLEVDPSWSPDGSSIAYTSYASGNADIWMQPVQGGAPVQITSSQAHDRQAQWSPDGTRLVFRSERDGGGLYVVRLSSRTEHQLTTFGYSPQWSPDSSEILFVGNSLEGVRGAPPVYVVQANGGDPFRVAPDLVREFETLHVAWFPTGRRVSLWGRRNGTTEWQFVTAEITGAHAVRSEAPALETGLALSKFVWAPSRKFLYFEGTAQGRRNVWRIRVDPESLAWLGLPEPMTTGAGSDQNIALSPDGSRLAFTAQTQRTSLWSFPFDAATGRVTGPGQPATSGGERETNPALASDGTELVYESVRGLRAEVWQRSLTSGNERLLLADMAGLRSVAHWSRDGSRLAYVRQPDRRDQSASLIVRAVNEGNERVIASVDQPGFLVSDWSPDERWLIGTCGRYRKSVCMLSSDGSQDPEPPIRMVASDPSRHLYAPRFSPNQMWVSFHAVDPDGPGVSQMYVAPLDGGPWVAMTDGRVWDDKARWAPDGRTLYFVSTRQGTLNVWGRRFDPAAGQPVGDVFQVTSFETPRRMLPQSIRGLEIGVSRQRLVTPLSETYGHIWMLDQVDR